MRQNKRFKLAADGKADSYRYVNRIVISYYFV